MRVKLQWLIVGLGIIAVSALPGRAQTEISDGTLPICDRNDPTLLLPDLVPDPPTALREVAATGRRQLLFTTGVGNVGDGPLIIEGKTISTPSGQRTQGWQVIWRRDGSKCTHTTGVFTFHPEHQHFHFDDFVGYELRANDPLTGQLMTTGDKVSFCLIDIGIVRGYPPAQPRQTNQQTCNSQEGEQVISVGWKDVYERTLPGQGINLDPDPPAKQVPPGQYFLVNRVDADNLLWDKNRSNNVSYVVGNVSMTPPNLGGLPPPVTPRPRNPHLHVSRHPSATPIGPVQPTPTAAPPVFTPTRTPRPRHDPHNPGGTPPIGRPTATERPTRTPRGGGGEVPTSTPGASGATPTPTFTPTPVAPAGGLAACDGGCDYATSQIRMTWYNYNGLLFSMFIRPSFCSALNPRPGDRGTIAMGNFLTDRKRDTGLSHQATFVMTDSQTGEVDNGGTVVFSPGAGGIFFKYNAALQPLSNIDAGADFPVEFELCVTIGGQSFTAHLVCQPHDPGMLCHAG